MQCILLELLVTATSLTRIIILRLPGDRKAVALGWDNRRPHKLQAQVRPNVKGNERNRGA